MHDDDLDPILNSIVAKIVENGGIVDVFRDGRGVVGTFTRMAPAYGKLSWDKQGNPLPKVVVPQFMCLHHTRGVEMLIRSAYEKLEVRKIQPNVYHVIVPR